MSELGASILFNRFPELAQQLRARAAQAVHDTTYELQEKAQDNAHVITGSMRASVYHAINDGDSDYAENSAEAEDLNKHVVILDELAPHIDAPPGMASIVGVSAMHGIFEEIMRGHQFLLPAADEMRPVFQQRCAEALR